jgi:hypothetical protein
MNNEQIKTSRHNITQDSYCKTYNNFYGMISGTRMDIQETEDKRLKYYKISGSLVENKDEWNKFLHASFWGAYELKKSVYGTLFPTLNDFLTFIQEGLRAISFNNNGTWFYGTHNESRAYMYIIYNINYQPTNTLYDFEYEHEIESLSNKNIKYGSPFSRVISWDCIYDCIQNQMLCFAIDNLNKSDCVYGSHWNHSSLLEDTIEFSNEYGDTIKTKVLNADRFWKLFNKLDNPPTTAHKRVSESTSAGDSISASEYLGTLQEVTTEIWKLHLQTNEYKTHKELQNLYNELFDLVDNLIESYQGKYGIIKGLKSVLSFKESEKVVDCIHKLADFIDDNKLVLVDNSEEDDDSELLSLVDDILNLFNKTIFLLSD